MSITILIDGVPCTAETGMKLSTLLAAHREGMEMPCGGHGRCGKCRVHVTGAVSGISDAERRMLTPEELADGIRLACLTTVEGACTVQTAQKAQSRILSAGDLPDMPLHPAFSRYGAAVDIGTTTLAARLYSRDGLCLSETTAMNPQSAFGADVISRIEAALRGDGGALAQVTLRAIDALLTELAETARIQTGEIDGLVLTGNTVMLYLLTQTSPEPLSHAPFRTDRLFDETMSAKELGLSAVSASAEVYLPPCIAAFIGADTASAMLAADVGEGVCTQLLCDIGTNGEIVLQNGSALLACSTAAGPAFEGAGISMGMSGRVGAVDHVTVRNGTLCAHVIGEAAPRGICGSGIVDAAACLLETGQLDETGSLDDDDAVIAAPVRLTQEDIRKVQLAKSAIHAGIRTLLHTAGVSIESVQTLLIAGGFGSYLDPVNAGRIGLLPDELTPRIRVIGNAALTGASMLLLNRELRAKTAALVRRVSVVELSANPVFAEEYMERMMF